MQDKLDKQTQQLPQEVSLPSDLAVKTSLSPWPAAAPPRSQHRLKAGLTEQHSQDLEDLQLKLVDLNNRMLDIDFSIQVWIQACDANDATPSPLIAALCRT